MLLGNVARYKNEVYCFVEDIILAKTTGDPAFVEISREMWADIHQVIAQKNSIFETTHQLAIVGWFHTHPNGLLVFMSGTDMNTQRLNFSQTWQASLVMNPHTNKYRAFFGADATEGRIVFPGVQG
ncbi:MAG: hypothetical protein LBL49_00070 [Clostridiales Family XIII bacterium]|nr:hypothetical protein [Clostridiales Family XIII bacterium]